MPSSIAGLCATFAGGVTGAYLSPLGELSTVGCRWHQCTRRAHSLSKNEKTKSASLFHRSKWGFHDTVTVIDILQNYEFLLYFVIKGSGFNSKHLNISRLAYDYQCAWGCVSTCH